MTKSRTLRRAGAVVLSLAMAASTLFIAPDSLAASNPKLSKTKVTVNVGKKKTITIKLTKAQKKQLSKVTVKTTAAKKKKATVTASKKTLKVTIKGKKKGTVKNVKIVLKFKKKVNKKKTWTLKIKKITVKAVTPTPTTTPESPASGIPASITGAVTNQVNVDGYENVVVAGDTADLSFAILDADGKPVKNEAVTARVETVQAPIGGGTPAGIPQKTLKFDGEKTVASVTTNDQGLARVVLSAPEKIKATEGTAKSSYVVTASCADKSDVKIQVKVLVAALKYGYVSDKGVATGAKVEETTAENADHTYGAIGTNAAAAGAVRAANLNGFDYVASNKYSATNEHALSFDSGVYFDVPNVSTSEDTKKLVDIADAKTDAVAYHTYSNTGIYGVTATGAYKDIELGAKGKADVSDATLTFGGIDLAPGTELLVLGYNTDADGNKIEYVFKKDAGNVSALLFNNYGNATDGNVANGEVFAKFTSDNNTANGNTVKIPASALQLFDGLRVKIVSEGAVNAAKAKGFSITSLTYTYNAKDTQAGQGVKAKDVKVNWETVTPTYEIEKEYGIGEAVTGDASYNALDSIQKLAWKKNGVNDYTRIGTKIKYSVPTYPYVGNVIIRIVAADGTVAKYYAAKPTLAAGANSYTLNPVAAQPYLITADEADITKSVGTVSAAANGTGVTVDSNSVGATFLRGTITSSDSNLKLDDENKYVYSYVLWNPLPETAAAANTGTYVALTGQTVDVNVQVVDSKGAAHTAVTNVAIEGEGLNDSDVVGGSLSKETDSNGKATFTLNAQTASKAFKAITSTTTLTGYKVKLSVGKNSTSYVDAANVYIIKPTLSYRSSVANFIASNTYTSADETTELVDNNKTTIAIGEKWEVEPFVSCEPVDGKAVTVESGAADKMTVSQLTGTTLPVKADGHWVVEGKAADSATATYAISGTDIAALKYTIDKVEYTSVGNGTGLAAHIDVAYDITGDASLAFAPVMTNGTKYVADDDLKQVAVKVVGKDGKAVNGQDVTFTCTQNVLDGDVKTKSAATGTDGVAVVDLEDLAGDAYIINAEATLADGTKLSDTVTLERGTGTAPAISDVSVVGKTVTLTFDKALNASVKDSDIKVYAPAADYATSLAGTALTLATSPIALSDDGKTVTVTTLSEISTAGGNVMAITLEEKASASGYKSYVIGTNGATVADDDALELEVTLGAGGGVVDKTAAKAAAQEALDGLTVNTGKLVLEEKDDFTDATIANVDTYVKTTLANQLKQIGGLDTLTPGDIDITARTSLGANDSINEATQLTNTPETYTFSFKVTYAGATKTFTGETISVADNA